MTAPKMSAFYHFIRWALALISFLLSLHLVACDSGCAYMPIFSPSTLIVKYNDPASAECTVCLQACPTSIFKVETPIGKTTSNGTNLSWSVQSLDEWEPAIFCYYEILHGGHCRSKLNVTVYQPPTHVSLSLVENSGRMLEGHEYTLRCTVQDVAPFENLQVTFYRGQTPLGSPQPKENKQAGPGNYTYTHTINVGGEDDGAQFWCEAKLVLGPDGPQPPPVVGSQILTANVSYKPKLKGPWQPEEVKVTEGERLHLSCSAKGNPSPTYTWTLPSSHPHPKSMEALTIDSVMAADEGEYKCLVENDMGNVTVKVKVVVHKPPTLVSISFVENSGPMLEDHDYTLQCRVQEVAPFEKLQVTFYRGQTPLGSPQPKENKQAGAGTYTYTHTINVYGEDNGAQFWCEAKLVLGADGPQPPPVVESQILTANVSYKPKLKEELQPAEVTVTEGERLHLSCSAEGNPRPVYTWTLPSSYPHPKSMEALTIDSVTAADEGEYKCLVKNDMGNVTVKFKVVVHVLTTTTLPPTTKRLENHSCRGTFSIGLMFFLFTVIFL